MAARRRRNGRLWTSGGPWLAAGLLLLGCQQPVGQGQSGDVAVALLGWQAVSEQRVGRTTFEYELRAECGNLGGDIAGAVFRVRSRKADTTVLTGELHFGPIPSKEAGSSLDTIRIRQDRAGPFDPKALEWVALTFGPDTKTGETRVDRDHFDFSYFAHLSNGARAELRFGGHVESTAPAATALIDAQVDAETVPARRRIGSRDVFTFRQDRTVEFDPTVLVWHIDLGTASADVRSPALRLFIPSAVRAGGTVQVGVDAEDDVGVAGVEFFVDGLSVATSTAPPYVFEYTAPDQAGGSLAIRAVARDAAGNTGEASGQVPVVAEADASPPKIDALTLPPQAAPGTSFPARAQVSDDRGITEVRFSVAGSAPIVDRVPPFEATLGVPADAPVGSQLSVDVEAVDGEGQSAHASGQLRVAATQDQAPPTGVTLQAPAEAAAGAPIALSATASDDVGVDSIAFAGDGFPLGEDAEAPYTLSTSIPAGAHPGDTITWTARAIDFSGNVTEATATTRVVAAGQGFVVGEAYDDASGRPLAGVSVRALPGGPETTTDARGVYRLALAEGRAGLALSRDGYTNAWREVDVPAGGVATPLDTRLAPRAAPVTLTKRDGGSLEAGGATLEVPVGALAADAPVALTPLSGQVLPAPLPLGWAPLAAFEVDAATPLAAPLALEAPGDAAGGDRTVAARFDPATRSWLRLALDAGAAGKLRFAVGASGAVAIARRDAAPEVPPLAEIGQPLAGVAPRAVPDGSSAELLPSPRVLFAASDSRAQVTARLHSNAALPSGTPIEVRFAERYARLDASSFEPPPMGQDLLLYPSAEGPESHFVASPAAEVDPATLREGSIDLAAQLAPGAAPAQVIDAAGGTLDADGIRVTIPAGALVAPAPVALRSFLPSDPALQGDARFSVLAGIELDLGGAALAKGALLDLPAPPGVALASSDQILVVRPRTVLGATRWELVALARAASGRIALVVPPAGLPLPGVTDGDRYVLVRPNVPTGFVAGRVAASDGSPAEHALVSVDALPFVALTDPGDPSYVVAAAVGAARVAGFDLGRGDEAGAAVRIAQPGATTALDLTLAAAGPRLVESVPADGAADVDAIASVRAVFSRPLDPASVSADSLSLSLGGVGVSGQVALSPDGRTVSFIPAAGLESDSEYTLILAPVLRDGFGNAFRGDRADGSMRIVFRTRDTTPPPRPEAGQVTTEYDVRDHLVIRGTQGAAEPGVVVSADNATRGTTVSVVSLADGSFQLALDASPADSVTLRYADAAANQTDVPLVRPVVPLEVRIAPAAPLLFLALGSERLVRASVLFSDGSERALDFGEMAIQNSDPAVASVDEAGAVRSLADGETRLRFAFGTPPYRPETELAVRVVTQGEVLAEQTIGAQGGDVELDNGFALRIPAGALPSDVPIRVEEFPLEAPLQIDRNGAPVRVLAVYRLSPDLHFERPITLELPYAEPSPALFASDDDLVAMSTTSPDLSDLVADGIEGSDDERPQQYLDRLNRVVRVLTNHFSIRVLMQVEDVEIAGSIPDHFDFEGAFVNYSRFDGTHAFDNKSAAGDQFIVHHATNPGVRVNARVTFPPGSAGQNVTIQVSDNIPGNDPFFMEGCDASGNNCDTTVHRHIGPNLTISFVALTEHDTITLRFTRGAHVDDVDVQPGARVGDQTPIGLPNNQAQMTTLINSSGQNGEVVASQTKGVTAHFFVNSKGIIYRLYPRTKEVGHAHNVNSFSTGIEIQQTTSPRDFYSGPQIDALVALTDFLINESGQHILVGERARWRRPNQLATVLPNTDRSHSPIGDFEPFITHREESRDYEGDPRENPGACDSGFHKNDPCGETYDIQAIVGALAYDFPGLIDTRGGDLLQSKPALAPGRGGAVALEYGLRPNQASDPMHIDQFAGIPGTAAGRDRRLEAVDQVVVAAGATRTLASNDHIANLIVRGTLQLGDEDDVTLRVSGTLYLAPGGRIVGAGTAAHPNGRNLTILAAGPVVLHGLVDLSGFSTNDTQPGHGGRLTVHSRAVSPLLVPTIVTQGGDVMTYDEEVDESPELFGEGGKGGDVTILGAPHGLIVLSGLKTPRTPPIQCDPLGGPAVLPGLRLLFNTIPFDRSAVPDTAPYSSSFLEEPPANAPPCPRVAEFHPQIGLTRTQGRGIVTSGGMGASVRVRIRAADTILRGSPGGAGGDIHIGFPVDEAGVVQAGTIRFRGVSLITGGSTGLIRTTIPLVTLQGAPPFDATMVQLTGSAGGRGSTGILRSFVSEILSGGVPRDLYFAPQGGDGGAGGAAGALFIEPAAKIFPAPLRTCTKVREVRGNDGGVPKDEPNRPVGALQTFCATVDGAQLELLTLAFAKSAEGVAGDQCGIEGPGGSCELLALGGSGGVAGGSVFNGERPPPGTFAEEGSAGRSGPAGPGGTLTLPQSILSAVEPF